MSCCERLKTKSDVSFTDRNKLEFFRQFCVNLSRLVMDMKLVDTLFPFQALIMCNLSEDRDIILFTIIHISLTTRKILRIF
jgi:hypothetical protein